MSDPIIPEDIDVDLFNAYYNLLTREGDGPAVKEKCLEMVTKLTQMTQEEIAKTRKILDGLNFAEKLLGGLCKSN